MTEETAVDESLLHSELSLEFNSMFELEKAYKNFPLLLAKYTIMEAKAIKVVDRITFELEVIVAELSNELCELYEAKNGKQYPPSSVQEVRRSYVPLCRKWKKKKIELYEATKTLNILKGAVKAVESRGFRMKELLETEKKRLFGENTAGYNERV